MTNFLTGAHPNSNLWRYQLTHMLHIPLTTSKSRPQLESSLRRAMTDPASENIHGDAFVRPDMLSLNLGSLSLLSPKRCDNAINILRGLDLQEIFQSSMRQLPFPHQIRSMSGSLQASIVGLEEPPRFSQIGRLYAPVSDPHEIKVRFFKAIRERFLAAKLLKLDEMQSINGLPMHTKIVDTRRLRSTIKNEKPSIMFHYLRRGKVPTKAAKFDVHEFYSTYKNFAWAQDFQLERLAISEIQLQSFIRNGRVVGRGYRDIASVPLPGAPDVDLEANMKGLTYKPLKAIQGIDPHARYDVTSR